MKWIMESKKKKHILTISYSEYEDSKEIKGFTNKCKDLNYIICLDYDFCSKEEVIEHKLYLERKYPGIVFHGLWETNKGFHLISLCKVSYNLLRDVLYDSHADPAFVQVPFITTLKSSTIRLSEKGGTFPKLVKMWPFQGGSNYPLSFAHYDMLRKAYPTFIKPIGKYDDTMSYEDVQYVEYYTKP